MKDYDVVGVDVEGCMMWKDVYGRCMREMYVGRKKYWGGRWFK